MFFRRFYSFHRCQCLYERGLHGNPKYLIYDGLFKRDVWPPFTTKNKNVNISWTGLFLPETDQNCCCYKNVLLCYKTRRNWYWTHYTNLEKSKNQIIAKIKTKIRIYIHFVKEYTKFPYCFVWIINALQKLCSILHLILKTFHFLFFFVVIFFYYALHSKTRQFPFELLLTRVCDKKAKDY